ncbi:putative WSC domain-containing protein 2 [Apostichopus japonicus]|uniref:Putative WSC domain-containing protein 2 n=1 Tax=Stichopus japonicus TaxID=307972 RepID=A0A2G8LEL2_STIJA|nr:putative WSC domain-containing protein 2 [Apostichopus japonicus]
MMQRGNIVLCENSLFYFITLVTLPTVMVYFATWEPTFIINTAEQPSYRSHNTDKLTSFSQIPIGSKLLHQVAPTVRGSSQVTDTEILNVSKQSGNDVPKAILNICQNVTLMPHGSLAVVALASLPGSGNTWLRYLIERVTGIYTGSIYNDRTLTVGGFLGETVPAYTGRTVAVKMHVIREPKKINKTILLIRDLFEAIKAEFNRYHGKNGKLHTRIAPIALYKSEAWPKLIDKQLNKWQKLIDDITANFANNDRLLIVYFQDLKSDLRTELKRIVEFLELPLNEDRLICTLKNQQGQFHRHHKALPFNPFNAAQQKLVEAAMTNGIKKIKRNSQTIITESRQE